ncbi:hypothetical protein [Marinilabilia salmonicolor]|uniref:Uncharacterized protein n=1 Tax=Marinilabilia salmonicolor TaxID=989 RepID=A0A368V655_9BACT|nr:hypothetical protein [Marinilabilia salmonicolor]RCW34501.1 hypothetical protein DFO77_1112 [Marinilabilia salmonicolor]
MIFISCEQDESVIDPVQEEVVPGNESISSARDWFFSQTGGDVLMEFKSQTKSTGSPKQTLPLLGDWESGLTRRIEHIRNVEVPVYSVEDEEAYIEALNGIGDLKSGQSGPKDEDLPSRTRFVVQTNEETGTTRGFMMTVIPDQEYLASGGSIDSIDYYYRGADFSGLIVFNHLDGSFANGWKYEEGEVKNCFLPSRNQSSNLLKSVTILHIRYCYNLEVSYAGYSSTKRVCHSEDQYVFTAAFSSAGGGSSLFTRPSSEFGTLGGGGGAYLPSASLQPLTNSIALNNMLLPSQTLLLEDALKELIGVCSDEYIYNELVAQGKKFNFKMDSSLGGLAGYDPASKTFSFRNNDAISSGKLKEEFFHAFQDAFYPGGTSQYGTTGKVNIEFEAKLYSDLSNVGCCIGFNMVSCPQKIKDDYLDWIIQLRKNPAGLLNTDYQQWLKLFNTYTPKYSSPLASNLSSPDALKSIISNSKCY